LAAIAAESAPTSLPTIANPTHCPPDAMLILPVIKDNAKFKLKTVK
jgi:hypothetical protein